VKLRNSEANGVIYSRAASIFNYGLPTGSSLYPECRSAVPKSSLRSNPSKRATSSSAGVRND
jgi:hypothetical protein